MNKLKKYIEEVIGEVILPNPIRVNQLGSLPLYLTENYKFYDAILLGKSLILAQQKVFDEISIHQLSKHQELLRKNIEKPVVFVFENIEAYNRKRLIEKHINFIVPGKQLFIPELFVDLRESFNRTKTHREQDKLLPTAQFLFVFHLLYKYNRNNLEQYYLKELANIMGYTPMAISKAVDNLKIHGLIEVNGTKEKQIQFVRNNMELWAEANHKNLLSSPVVRRVFVDELPKQALFKSNMSALPEYSDMNPSRQEYYAIEKTAFYALQRNNELVNLNEYEGRYCIELWKYNPIPLVKEMNVDKKVVDPLSLFLSLKDEQDERIEMALEQIIENYIYGKRTR
jgi:hypothetical protein